MAQNPALHASGLERDDRQDEFPTTWQQEFPTRQDEFPTAYNPSGQTLYNGDPRVITEINSDILSHKSATKPRSRVCGLRKSTLWLVVIMIVLLVVFGIGAGILGSRINSSQKSRCVLSR